MVRSLLERPGFLFESLAAAIPVGFVIDLGVVGHFPSTTVPVGSPIIARSERRARIYTRSSAARFITVSQEISLITSGKSGFCLTTLSPAMCDSKPLLGDNFPIMRKNTANVIFFARHVRCYYQ